MVNGNKPRVGLFVTCLVDFFRPEIGFQTISLLESAGCEITVPDTQTCCGQPGYNSGDRNSTRAIAEQVIAAFEPFDYVVAPSGSCAAMIRHHYPDLFSVSAPDWRARADAVAEKTYEITQFLVDVLAIEALPATSGEAGATITYHDACSGLRELQVKTQPRQLLAIAGGVTLLEMTDSEVCCGFGGTFCVKYPEISNRMVSDKVANIDASDAQTLVAGDLGCLLNIAGKLKREGSPIKVRHVVDVLCGAPGPAIGEESD